jgi:Spy/CpxP family protein refolding chaperone
VSIGSTLREGYPEKVHILILFFYYYIMNKSILISSAAIMTIGAIAVTTFATSTFAASNATSTESVTSKIHTMVNGWGGGHGHHGGGEMGGHKMEILTPAEQTALTSMTDTQKKDFFEKKHTEMETRHDAREAVIDKLLAGTALTAEEEILRKTIITEHAAHQIEEVTMKTKMTQMKAIFDKKRAGIALTVDEQKLLDSMPKMGGHRGGHGRGPEPKDANDNDTETDDGPGGR